LAKESNPGGLIGYALDAFATVLFRRAPSRDGGNASETLRHLVDAIGRGNQAAARDAFGRLAPALALDDTTLRDLGVSVDALTRSLPRLLGPSVEVTTLREAAHHLERIGGHAVSLHAPDMAYNLFECAYHLASIIEDVVPELAHKLLQHSDAAKRDQRASAIWRYAIERLRAAIHQRSGWIDAVDAIEVALNVPPADTRLQEQLFQRLWNAVRGAQNTPIEEIVAILPIQGPPAAVPATIRRDSALMLAKSFLGNNMGAASGQAVEFAATIAAQNLVDDLRLRLVREPSSTPKLTWDDMALHHDQLANAIPLGPSLMADLDRTGEFMMALIHEVGHAYSLIGPIGRARTSLRAAVHQLELLLVASGNDTHGHEYGRDSDEFHPLVDLPDQASTHPLAVSQLEASACASILEAIWTPWLEGVAVYLELLCDPSADPNEISAPHEAVRSLVDFRLDPNPGESEEDYATRLGEANAKAFDDFCSAALRRYSRLRHIGYVNWPDAREREVYLLGYLVVRSLVARWEQTLGRRLPPAEAAKLLLDATRNGTASALEASPAGGIESFETECAAAYQLWLTSLATLGREALEHFFQPVARDQRKYPCYWKDGRPWRLDDTPSRQNEIVRLGQEQIERFVTASGAFVSRAAQEAVKADTAGTSGGAASAPPDFTGNVRDLFNLYMDLLGLLPVGRDYARFVTINESGRVAICPRTYVGLTDKTGVIDEPRYSAWSFLLDGGAEELRRVQDICGRLVTARVEVTRIIDFIGHPHNPLERPHYSFACFWLGREWEMITVGGDPRFPLGSEHEAFKERLRARHNPPAFFRGESATLGSTAFLARRLQKVDAGSPVAARALAFDKLACSRTIAVKAASQAFDVSADEIGAALSQAMSGIGSRNAIADFLHATGVEQAPRPLGEDVQAAGRLLSIVAMGAGIIPFKGES
jgi:hypothetical protein